MTLAWRGAVSKPATKRARSAGATNKKVQPKPDTTRSTTKKTDTTSSTTTGARNRTFKELISPYPGEVQELAKATRSLMLELLPRVNETVDPTGPYVQYGYDHGYAGVVSYITVNQKGVKLGVARGVSLPDPKKLLQGTGKGNRHVG